MNNCMNRIKMHPDDSVFFAWHEKEYRKDNQYFLTTISELQEEFKKHPDWAEEFKNETRQIGKGLSTYEYLAIDWSIPLILVKYFQKIWGY